MHLAVRRGIAAMLVLFTLTGGCAPSGSLAPTAKPAPAAPSPPAAQSGSSPPPAATPSPGASPAAALSPVPASPLPMAASPSPSPSPAAAPAPARRLNVVATTTQIQDFARNVGRERITLLAILPPNSDPHDYQPTAEDARKIAQADVIFYNGIGLEPWIDDLSKNARPQVPAVSLAEAAGLTIKQRAEDGDEHEGEHDTGDPHVWYDPTNARKMVDTIRATLSSVESAGAPAYAASAAAYQAELDELDRQIQQLVATIPANGRKLVTSHESFRYYADRYGFAYLGAVIPSISTEAEPSAAEIQKLVQTIRREQVRAIFTDRSWNPRLEERIAQQAGVKVVSSLYGDTLGPAGSEGDTYIRAMLYNTRVIVEALR